MHYDSSPAKPDEVAFHFEDERFIPGERFELRGQEYAYLPQDGLVPHGLTMIVRDGIVHPSGGVTDERTRPATIVAAENARGVKTVHDHLFWSIRCRVCTYSRRKTGWAKAS